MDLASEESCSDSDVPLSKVFSRKKAKSVDDEEVRTKKKVLKGKIKEDSLLSNSTVHSEPYSTLSNKENKGFDSEEGKSDEDMTVTISGKICEKDCNKKRNASASDQSPSINNSSPRKSKMMKKKRKEMLNPSSEKGGGPSDSEDISDNADEHSATKAEQDGDEGFRGEEFRAKKNGSKRRRNTAVSPEIDINDGSVASDAGKKYASTETDQSSKNDSDSDSSNGTGFAKEQKKRKEIKNKTHSSQTGRKRRKEYTSTDDERPLGKKNKQANTSESSRLKKYKRLVILAGFRFNYKKMFMDVKSESKKIRMIKDELTERGLTTFTIEGCKNFRMKKEQDEELEELRKNNIYESESGLRATRSNTRRRRGVYLSTSSSSENDGENRNLQAENENIYSRLKGIVSDESD